MRALFDTSVLVAAMVVTHKEHRVCVDWLDRAKTNQIQGLISNHTLAELYSVLTRLPSRPVISPALAQRQIYENLQGFEKINLTTADYNRAIALMTALNLPGGGIFDALIGQAVIKGEANALLTLNPKHFVRLGEPIEALVQVPS